MGTGGVEILLRGYRANGTPLSRHDEYQSLPSPEGSRARSI